MDPGEKSLSFAEVRVSCEDVSLSYLSIHLSINLMSVSLNRCLRNMCDSDC